jgi:hypothetical protein
MIDGFFESWRRATNLGRFVCLSAFDGPLGKFGCQAEAIVGATG